MLDIALHGGRISKTRKDDDRDGDTDGHEEKGGDGDGELDESATVALPPFFNFVAKEEEDRWRKEVRRFPICWYATRTTENRCFFFVGWVLKFAACLASSLRTWFQRQGPNMSAMVH